MSNGVSPLGISLKGDESAVGNVTNVQTVVIYYQGIESLVDLVTRIDAPEGVGATNANDVLTSVN